MTDRLTDEEIRNLRELSAAATKGPAHAINLDGYQVELAAYMRNAIDRLLDELLEHRAREASIRNYWVDCFAQIGKAVKP